MRGRQTNSGFGLIEVTVAIGLVGFMLYVLAQGLNISFNSSRRLAAIGIEQDVQNDIRLIFLKEGCPANLMQASAAEREFDPTNLPSLVDANKPRIQIPSIRYPDSGAYKFPPRVGLASAGFRIMGASATPGKYAARFELLTSRATSGGNGSMAFDVELDTEAATGSKRRVTSCVVFTGLSSEQAACAVMGGIYNAAATPRCDITSMVEQAACAALAGSYNPGGTPRCSTAGRMLAFKYTHGVGTTKSQQPSWEDLSDGVVDRVDFTLAQATEVVVLYTAQSNRTYPTLPRGGDCYNAIVVNGTALTASSSSGAAGIPTGENTLDTVTYALNLPPGAHSIVVRHASNQNLTCSFAHRSLLVVRGS